MEDDRRTEARSAARPSLWVCPTRTANPQTCRFRTATGQHLLCGLPPLIARSASPPILSTPPRRRAVALLRPLCAPLLVQTTQSFCSVLTPLSLWSVTSRHFKVTGREDDGCGESGGTRAKNIFSASERIQLRTKYYTPPGKCIYFYRFFSPVLVNRARTLSHSSSEHSNFISEAFFTSRMVYFCCGTTQWHGPMKKRVKIKQGWE